MLNEICTCNASGELEPSEQCVLPAQTDLEAEGVVSGMRFGVERDSRREYHKLPKRFKLRYLIHYSFSITMGFTGLIFCI